MSSAFGGRSRGHTQRILVDRVARHLTAAASVFVIAILLVILSVLTLPETRGRELTVGD